jgi:hypothetical protein
MRKGAAGDPLFARVWVHVFEEDTPRGAVFRPEGADIPLSRRPRERIELHDDGSARIWMPGPDDRFAEQPANWKQERDAVVLRGGPGDEFRIVDQSTERLIVDIRRGATKR